jgi:glycosyltransferase involved in cell wall biosynthesis
MLIVFSGNTSWGMYNFRLGLIKKFIDLGYDVCVVAPEDKYTDKIKAEAIPFYPVKKLKRFSTNPVHDFILYKEYIKIYKTLEPSFIFHYTIKPNIYGTLAARFCHIKSISITTGLGNAFAVNGLLRSFAKKLYKFSSLFALEVWFLNSADKDLFVKRHIIPEHKGFVLPGEGIDTSLFKPSPHPFNNDVTTFLLFSRMQYDKGVQIFVEAVRILQRKGYKLSALLLGEVDMNNPEAIPLDKINTWQQQGIITYLGNTENVKNYIDKADVIVLPSYYMEGVPRVLLEAACMAKPIITTRNTGCAEVVDDGLNGYLCEIKNVDDLALQMEKFIHLPINEREKMGIAGRRKMEEKFDERIIINIYKSKLEQYLS